MRTMRDFMCRTCGEVTEAFRQHEIKTIDCSWCEGVADEMLSTPTVKLEGLSGDFPGAHDRWARIREENKRIKSTKL